MKKEAPNTNRQFTSIHEYEGGAIVCIKDLKLTLPLQYETK